MLLVTIRYLWLLNEEFCPAPSACSVVFPRLFLYQAGVGFSEIHEANCETFFL